MSSKKTKNGNPQPSPQIQQLLAKHNFGSLEEVNNFLQSLMGTSAKAAPTNQNALDRAQDLIYDAWENPVKLKRIQLAKQALQISADCADAYVILANEEAKTLAAAKALYEQGVQAGERGIGKDKFKEYKGHFWGFIETRPYMRARAGLALTLWQMGELKEAVAHYEAMLRLNPGDNQGLRYALFTLYLTLDELVALEKLFKKYPNEWMAHWKYSHALFLFRKEGQTDKAAAQLKDATTHNPFVPAYLLGDKKLPKQIPDYISPGREDEAVGYASENKAVWAKVPGALSWLREAVAMDGSQTV